ncbi:MAG: hypothetical protein BGO08_05220 [Altererythrobacter sp. 66-12]|nr:MAG: hypothetical protein BGO08_05220 [Altererythrobacter sp. 66-12]
MMMRHLFAALVLALILPVSARAQQDTEKCATVTVSRASEADVPALLADAACFASALVSAADSQELRLRKARELVGRPDGPPEASPGDPHAGHVMPAAPVGEWVPSPSLEGSAPLKAEFPVAQGLAPSWGTGAIPDIYDKNEGAFRFTCGGDGPVNYDDPLLYPKQPGKSHLHKFWGPAKIDAFSTTESLAQQRDSNCNYGPNTLNRSGYWMPALVNEAGQVVNPDLVSVYYKRWRSISPFCQARSGKAAGTCLPLPNGIKFIFGWDPTRPDEPGQGMSWYCVGPKNEDRGGHFPDLDALFASGCKAGDTLVADLMAPNCWDGKHLDAPDHRAHMAWGDYGDWGYYRCPASHPYLIPQTQNKATWIVSADMIRPDGTSAVRLSSDAMKAGAKPGGTLHADYIEAWIGEAKAMWTEHCIEEGLSCSGGDLGNGKQLIGASQPKYGWTNPKRLAAAPAQP